MERKIRKGPIWISQIIIFLIILSTLLLIHFSLYDFSKRTDYQIQQIVANHLADVGKQSVISMEEERERVLSEMRYTADFLSLAGDIEWEDEVLLLNQLGENCHFSRVRLIAPDGKLYSTDGELIEKSNSDYIEHILAGECGLTDLFNSSVTDKDVFAYYVPVFRKGEVAGGIAGIVTVDEMMDQIESAGFDGKSYSYILNQTGTVVIQTTHPDSLYTGRNFFQFLNKEVDESSKSMSELRAAMKEGKSGIFTYRKLNELRIAYYTPLDMNGWYAVTAVSVAVSNNYVAKINRTAFELTLKVSIVFLLLGFVIIVETRKNKKVMLEAKEEEEVSRQRMELALSHTSNLIFEYKIKDDSFCFITSCDWGGAHFPQELRHISEQASGVGLLDHAYSGRFEKMLKEAAAGTVPKQEELLGGHAFPEEMWIRAAISPVKDGNGKVLEAIGTLEDITQEKMTRQRFAQEEKYREALLSEAVSVWSIDLIKREVTSYTARGKNRMNGKSLLVYSSRLIARLGEQIHPDDRERILEFVKASQLLSDYYLGKRDLKELFRVKFMGEDDYKWVSCTITLISEPISGNPVAYTYITDVDKETRRKIELAYSSERDPLTGLYNRRNISEKVGLALQGSDHLSCLMMMDLDGFKGVNDRYGHQEGDRVLKNLASILEKTFRSGDLVARLGGDEFIVFLDRLPDKECACARAEEVRMQVENLTVFNQLKGLSISIGIAFAPEDGDSFMQLYKKADEALYEAKREGKNQIVLSGCREG